MLLKNRFDDEDKHRVWEYHKYCSLCGSNQFCSLHHIKGTSSNSILNSIMLCHKCHLKADGKNVSDKEFQNKCIAYTINQAKRMEYIYKQRDKDFLNERE